jgi:hypothetical protein
MSHSGVADEDAALSQSEVHDVLRNDRRRRVIERLVEEGTESVRDLAEHIASIESGETPPPRNVRQSVYVSLHQTHLPKLDDLEIVVYDDDAKEVWLAERADQVLVYLEDGHGTPSHGPWPAVTLGVALVGLAGATVGVAASVQAVAVGVPVVALLVVGGVAAVRLAGGLDPSTVPVPGRRPDPDETDSSAAGASPPGDDE